MKKVYVITGGGSGMGLATVKALGKDHKIIISGRTASKLQGAVDELVKEGYDVEAFSCDVSSRESVKALAQFALSKGDIDAVIHAAGVSPHMGNGETIIRINALGTYYVDEEFSKVMKEGTVILNVSSMSAYILPAMMLPTKSYKLIFNDEEKFLKKLLKRSRLIGKNMETSLGYPISKNFVCWLTKRLATSYYEKGIRIISVSPGNFETPMGNLESEQGAMFLKNNAIKRFGNVDEIAVLFAHLIDPRLGYLTGEDIVCDGGCIGNLAVYSKKEQKKFTM